MFSLRDGFCFAKRVRGPSRVFHSVEVLFCPAGSELFLLLSLRDGFCFAKRVRGLSSLARPRSLRSETPSTATQQRAPGQGPSVSA